MFAASGSGRLGRESLASEKKLRREEAGLMEGAALRATDELNQLRREDEELLKKIQSVKAALSQEESLLKRLKQQEDVGAPEPRPPPPAPASC